MIEGAADSDVVIIGDERWQRAKCHMHRSCWRDFMSEQEDIWSRHSAPASDAPSQLPEAHTRERIACPSDSFCEDVTPHLH